eukprot:scaffold7368_cov143-Isochrysis_galbana.AAC.2
MQPGRPIYSPEMPACPPLCRARAHTQPPLCELERHKYMPGSPVARAPLHAVLSPVQDGVDRVRGTGDHQPLVLLAPAQLDDYLKDGRPTPLRHHLAAHHRLRVPETPALGVDRRLRIAESHVLQTAYQAAERPVLHQLAQVAVC